ncbi:MAG: hypothetical protein CM1200mP24_02440 [Gammaproteobacteria bacterium]|nr:MAG: hypothetical protein CM1200mP24_02440 [Gammaproteobacteria bacterium]
MLSPIQGVGVSSLVNNALEAVDRGWKFLDGTSPAHLKQVKAPIIPDRPAPFHITYG